MVTNYTRVNAFAMSVTTAATSSATSVEVARNIACPDLGPNDRLRCVVVDPSTSPETIKEYIDVTGYVDNRHLTIVRAVEDATRFPAVALTTAYKIVPVVTSATASPLDIQEFTASGTWSRPGWANWSLIFIVGNGSGGGSGRRGAAGTARGGGGGGGAGTLACQLLRTSSLGSTETVTVAAGGVGGQAVTADSTDGFNGSASGVTTSFGAHAFALGGNFGRGGTTLAGAGGAAQALYTEDGTGGGSGGVPSPAPGGEQFVGRGPTGGGGGAGISAANAVSDGATGGPHDVMNRSGSAAGLTAGSVNGANGADVGPSGIGGGGGASRAGTGGNGGTGGRGAGGGGGAAAPNGSTGGAGGAGGSGYVVVYSW